MKKIIHIEGMSCGGCAARVEKALGEFPGVEKVIVNLEKGQVEVVGVEEALEETKLKGTVEKLGYTVKGVD